MSASLSPEGTLLYVSAYTDSALSEFEVAPNGTLTYADRLQVRNKFQDSMTDIFLFIYTLWHTFCCRFSPQKLNSKSYTIRAVNGLAQAWHPRVVSSCANPSQRPLMTPQLSMLPTSRLSRCSHFQIQYACQLKYPNYQVSYPVLTKSRQSEIANNQP